MYIIKEYSSVHNMIETIETTKKGSEWTKLQKNEPDDSVTYAWAYHGGVKSLDDTLTEARTLQGLEQACHDISAIAEQISHTIPAPASIKRTMTYAHHGATLNVHRVLRGQAKPWRRSTQAVKTTLGKILPIILPTAVSASIDHEQIYWSTAATLGLALSAEHAGYRTELIALTACASAWGDTGYSHSVCLKAAHEPWNTQAVAIAMQPTWLRRCMFRLTEMVSSEIGEDTLTYGRPIQGESLQELIKQCLPSYTSAITGPTQSSNINTLGSAIQWVKETQERLK